MREISGDFAKGDAVEIVTLDGKLVGQGLSAYDAGEARKVAGAKSDRIEALIGYRRRPALIEKDGRTHTLIRADVLEDLAAASEASIGKAKQMIDEQGDRLFT